jgi:HlyD family secretion protein
MRTTTNQVLGWLLVILTGLATGCRWNTDKPDGSGTIECTQVQVAPQISGRVATLPPQEGDRLKKGDRVTQIDPTDYVLRRDEARAAQVQAQAQLDLIQAGARTEDVQRARAQVDEARAAATAAAADLKRIKEVFAQQTVTARQMDEAQSAADRTAAAQAAAEQNLAKLQAGNRKEDIAVAQAQVDLAKVRLAQAEQAVAYCTVASPMDGTVTTRSREEGEMVAVGTPLVTLSRLDEVWLSIYVPETRLARVKLGQPAQVRIDGEAKRFEGTVTFISPEAEFTPKNVQTPDERAKLVYRVKITLKNPDGVFKPGMPADGFLGSPS